MVTKKEQYGSILGSKGAIWIAVVSVAVMLLAWVMARQPQVISTAHETSQIMPALNENQPAPSTLPEDSRQNQAKEHGGEINGLRNGNKTTAN